MTRRRTSRTQRSCIFALSAIFWPCCDTSQRADQRLGTAGAAPPDGKNGRSNGYTAVALCDRRPSGPQPPMALREPHASGPRQPLAPPREPHPATRQPPAPPRDPPTARTTPRPANRPHHPRDPHPATRQPPIARKAVAISGATATFRGFGTPICLLHPDIGRAGDVKCGGGTEAKLHTLNVCGPLAVCLSGYVVAKDLRCELRLACRGPASMARSAASAA